MAMIDRVLDTDGDPPVAVQFNQNPMLRVTRGPLHDRPRLRSQQPPARDFPASLMNCNTAARDILGSTAIVSGF
jgi:hypothetical protein